MVWDGGLVGCETLSVIDRSCRPSFSISHLWVCIAHMYLKSEGRSRIERNKMSSWRSSINNSRRLNPQTTAAAAGPGANASSFFRPQSQLHCRPERQKKRRRRRIFSSFYTHQGTRGQLRGIFMFYAVAPEAGSNKTRRYSLLTLLNTECRQTPNGE